MTGAISHPPVEPTPREREVAKLVAEGLSNKQIAHRLEVTPSTVKTHVERLLAKTSSDNRTQLTRFVLMNERGWDGS